MTRGPSRGLPPRTYVPIVAVVMLVLGGIIGYFLRIGLSTTGAAFGPAVPQQGDSNIQATSAPGNSVGGGSPPLAASGAPPAPIQRLLTELKGRVARDPRDVSALAGLATLYSDAGKFAQALPYYERGLAVAPNDRQLRTDYAAALHGVGQNKEALAQLQIVLNANPDYGPALYDEGMIAAGLGQQSEAVTALQKFLKVAPQDPHVGEVRAALKNLGD